MTEVASTLNEDELLGAGETTLTHHDAVDEEELLGTVSRNGTTDFETETLEADTELLGETQSDVTSSAVNGDVSIDVEEELDYEEEDEEDREERTGRFTSERNKSSTSHSASSSNSQNEAGKGEGGRKMTGPPVQKTWTTGPQPYHMNNRGRGNWNHGNQGPFRGGGRGQQRFGMNGGPASHFMGGGPPQPLMGPPGVDMGGPRMSGGGKIILNPNFVPPQPLVRLNIDGAPPLVMQPLMPPRSMAGPPRVPGMVIPRLPNGMPLVALPPNHGAAGFGAPPLPGGMGGPPRPLMGGPPAHWDQAVAAFLNQPPGTTSTTTSRRRRRSSSYSSYSSYSSRSRSSGSSRSRSPRRKGRHHRSNRDRSSGRGDRRGRGADRQRGNNRQRGGAQRRDERVQRPRDRRDDKEVRAECAKVVGVDNEYLSKMEEQKRKRDETLRKKEQRRFGSDEKSTQKASTSTNNDREKKSSSTSRKSESEDQPTDSDPLKKKAYLCVNVKNLTKLDTARTRIEILAKELGALRKCWQVNEDQVNIVFMEHDKAKAFMVKYNNKVLSGLRVQVGLEKAYLNLADIKQ